jgi:class 3 adenylate cyclase
MTEFSHKPKTVEYVIVVFDMCSSSNIIEDLTLTGNIKRLRDFMIALKKWLKEKSEEYGFEVYKFTGDGWIVLFPADVAGQDIINCLQALSAFFHESIKTKVLPYLETKPEVVGLTFGIEKGPLVKILMLGKQEFLGRPLNIACRLQNAVKDRGKSPEYRALVSNHFYIEYLKGIKGLKTFPVDRVLRNIRGGAKYKCVKLNLSASIES